MNNLRFKFRFWNKNSNEMLYFEEWGNSLSFNSLVNNFQYIPMQCTGLSDMNDKLIYEGDIIQFYYANRPSEMPFCNSSFYEVLWDEEIRNGFYIKDFVNIKEIYKDEMDLVYLVELGSNPKSDGKLKIIGNVYENMKQLEKLLEEQKEIREKQKNGI